MARVVLGAERAQRFQRHHLRVLEVAQPFHVEDDDLAQRGQPLAHLEDLVELLLVLHEHEHRRGVAEQVLGLRRGVGRVDAVGDPARAEDAQVGEHPVAIGIGLDRGDLAGLQAERGEAHADLARRAPELLPGERAPDAEVLLAQDHLRAARANAVPEQARHAAVPGRAP
jgi:hypothetical protein